MDRDNPQQSCRGLVPNPVLKHLRGGFDEIARDNGAGRLYRARVTSRHGMAEFVKEVSTS
jgi:hypothetical protein